MNKNVIIYCRVSTDKQSKTWESLSVQEQECRNFCKKNEYQVMSVFSEQFTWTKDKRPKIQEALEFIKNSELNISYIIVLKIDRVSRWWITIHNSFKKQFMDVWVALKDVYGIIWEDRNVVEIEWINTDKYNWAKSNTNQIAENMTVMMSENERNTILQRMLWQAIKNNKRWYKVRNSDYGFRNVKIMTPFWKKTIQVEKLEESIFIKKIFELRARWDLSDIEIVEEINLMWFKSRQRDKWNRDKTKIIGVIGWVDFSVKQLQYHVKATVYAWVILEEWTWNKPIKAPYDWLVTIDLWNKANRWKYKINPISEDEIVMEYYKWETKLEAPIIQKRKNYNPEYPYWKVLMCPECWWNLTATRSKSHTWKYHFYYSCKGRKSVKHKNYSLKRDEVNKYIEELFSKLRFDNDTLKIFDFLSENIYKERESEKIENSKIILKNIKELEARKKLISNTIQNIIRYPDLLESQNKEIQEVKQEINKLQKKLTDEWEILWLARFKQYSRKILPHLDKLLLQRENPAMIELAFDLAFGWKVVYDKLNSHTLITDELLALNTQKKTSQKVNFNQSNAVDSKWWVTNSNYHTVEEYIVKVFDNIDKWQYVIDKIKF